ncbi:hypothetical protein FSARC_1661 [Fusarium sarcochroum]|uniref:PD-(D/E)XK nuclease-like domain-containing protein n=1 Tax=Fusarium sarcochroum TaxID=1208366 RepID=A0A8H4XEK7_9HYPO|nr:hypothetical protein FSARC_1661 [Fusarium sarcochroum]
MSTASKTILDWLDDLPDDLISNDTLSTPQEHVPSKKRLRPGSRAPLSPPTSQSGRDQHASIQTKLVLNMSLSTPSNKRRKLVADAAPATNTPYHNDNDNDNDNDETPTQPRRAARSLRGSDTSSLSYKSSRASNHSSPSKMLSSLALNPAGLDRKQLDLDDPDVPGALVRFCIEMDSLSSGNCVVPAYLKPEISKLKSSTPSFMLFHPGVFDDSSGPTVTPDTSIESPSTSPLDSQPKPMLDEILQLVGDAKDCHSTEQDEAGWNNLVHTPLLRSVFYGRSARGLQLDGFSPCTSANILSDYRIDNYHSKRVDYVFQLNPSKDDNQPATIEAVKKLRTSLNDDSINHTSSPSLRAYPISVSIETKRSGDSETKAQLQMGNWQMAQWRHLSKLAGDDLKKLPFIPGMFIHGHAWKFVASTYHNGKTVIAGVRRLRAWALEVFWPWYKAHPAHIVGLAAQDLEITTQPHSSCSLELRATMKQPSLLLRPDQGAYSGPRSS